MSRFAIVPTAWLRDPELTSHEKLVLAVLSSYADQQGCCWPAVTTIAKDCASSERSVQYSLKRLTEVGALEVVRRRKPDGSAASNAYWILGYDKRVPVVQEMHQGGATIAPGVVQEMHPNNTSKNKTTEHATTTTTALTFANEAQQAVYEGYRRSSRIPSAFDASLQTLLAPISGGKGCTIEQLGAALLELAGNGEAFNLSRLRGYLRKAEQGAPPEVTRGGYVSATFRASDDARRKLGLPPREPVQL